MCGWCRNRGAECPQVLVTTVLLAQPYCLVTAGPRPKLEVVETGHLWVLVVKVAVWVVGDRLYLLCT